MARILSWSGKVEDDRGSRFRPRVYGEDRVSLRLLTRAEIRARRNSDPARHAAFKRLTLLKHRASGVEKNIVLVVSGTVVVGFAVIAHVNGNGSWAWTLGMTLGVFVMLGLILLLDRHEGRKLRAECETLPLGCLSCGYDLTGIPPADDGCVVCPECGAAWDFDAMNTNRDKGD